MIQNADSTVTNLTLTPKRPKGTGFKPDNTLKAPWTFLAKEQVICLCEGAQFCTRENPRSQKGGNAIPGIHGNWVGDNILAMARPWQENVHKYSLVDAFKRNNIGMILNLQEVGEHDSCGPGCLPSSGFSYDPDSFMAACIGFYNFSWVDMGVPNLDKMMDIVQVMAHVTKVEGRKIAVHCHAGLGRTGLSIACYFVFMGMYDAKEAVLVTREGRSGALQTSSQVMFVSIFEQYLAHLRCKFKLIQEASLYKAEVVAPLSLEQQQHTFMQGLKQDRNDLKSSAYSQQNQDNSTFDSTLLHLSNIPSEKTALQPNSTRSNKVRAQPRVGTALEGGTCPLHTHDNVHGASPKDVVEKNGVRTEVFACGLTVVRPSYHRTMLIKTVSFKRASESSAYAPVAKAGDKITRVVPFDNQTREGAGAMQMTATSTTAAKASETGRGLGENSFRDPTDRGMGTNAAPWSKSTHIIKGKYNPYWVPEPPESYAEALRRQQRLLHGPERRSHVNIHKLVMEAVLTVISAARSFASAGGPQLHSEFMTSSSPQAKQGDPNLVKRVTPDASPASTLMNGVQSPGSNYTRLSTFAHAMCACISVPCAGYDGSGLSHLPPMILKDPTVATALAGDSKFSTVFMGRDKTAAQLEASVRQLKLAANQQSLKVLRVSPVAVALLILEDFFFSFERHAPSLSVEGLAYLAQVYMQLPFWQLSSDVEVPDAIETAGKVLSSFPMPDLELLLLFSAMMRHVERASGVRGCEVHLVHVCRWVSRLLLGPLMSVHSAAEESIMSVLWWLLRDGPAYASAILLKKQRAERRGISIMPTWVVPPNPENDVQYLTFNQMLLKSAPSVGSEGGPQPVPILLSNKQSVLPALERGPIPPNEDVYEQPSLPPTKPRSQAADLPSPGLKRILAHDAIQGIYVPKSSIYQPPEHPLTQAQGAHSVSSSALSLDQRNVSSPSTGYAALQEQKQESNEWKVSTVAASPPLLPSFDRKVIDANRRDSECGVESADKLLRSLPPMHPSAPLEVRTDNVDPLSPSASAVDIERSLPVLPPMLALVGHHSQNVGNNGHPGEHVIDSAAGLRGSGDGGQYHASHIHDVWA
ncbi:hypothetical protein CEUSTIGMA_g795.t1 [Chlamydomonas eustigma]|uniref:Tyrosine specific protein phosphatases domain-containing protein n=1 Tax=Chlamydomonas eustigma TaxID=1157962 RepID=A0A250WRP9_9CHLO|nr:hypothetical protein CEUSTIGMA_g795.t1 [Chlamydomonas eustigma]|eukprot:GAX73342.1 hypothetical protein CEUSTIGMA_g795.t1 [Chlamydomonas eustigma]